jgi:hypothetical protein
VILADVDKAAIQAAADEITATGHQGLAIARDVSDNGTNQSDGCTNDVPIGRPVAPKKSPTRFFGFVVPLRAMLSVTHL